MIINCYKCYGAGSDAHNNPCKECNGNGLLMTAPISKIEAKKFRGDNSPTPIADIYYKAEFRI